VEPGDDPSWRRPRGGRDPVRRAHGRWPGPTASTAPAVPLLKGVVRRGRTRRRRRPRDLTRSPPEPCARPTRPSRGPLHLARRGDHPLTASLATPTARSRPPSPSGPTRSRRHGPPTAVRVASVSSRPLRGGPGYLGVQMCRSRRLAADRAARRARTTATTASPSALRRRRRREVLPIVSATDFDPFGNNKQENPALVPLAVDSNPATAWTTVHYKRPTCRARRRGLLLDLGRRVRVGGDPAPGRNGTDSHPRDRRPDEEVSAFTSMAESRARQQPHAARAETGHDPLPRRLADQPALGRRQLPGGIADVRVLG